MRGNGHIGRQACTMYTRYTPKRAIEMCPLLRSGLKQTTPRSGASTTLSSTGEMSYIVHSTDSLLDSEPGQHHSSKYLLIHVCKLVGRRVSPTASFCCRSMKRARDVRDQLEGLMERVEIELTSNPLDNIAIRKVPPRLLMY